MSRAEAIGLLQSESVLSEEDVESIRKVLRESIVDSGWESSDWESSQNC